MTNAQLIKALQALPQGLEVVLFTGSHRDVVDYAWFKIGIVKRDPATPISNECVLISHGKEIFY